MDIAEILTALAEYVGDDRAKAKDIAQRLRSTDELKPIASVIYNAGAARHKGETGPKVAELEAKVTELTEATEELTTQLEAAKAKPNEQQAEWDRQKKKLEDAKAKAETDLKVERDGRTTDRVGHIAGRVAGHLTGQVDPEYLSEVLTSRIAKRVKPSENGKVDLLADDETPYDGEGEAVEKALAADVLKAVPDKFRLRPMTPGGGVSGGGGPGPVTVDQIAQEKRQQRGAERF